MERPGDYAGGVKGDEAEIQTLLDDWVAEAVLSPAVQDAAPRPAPEVVSFDCPFHVTAV